MKTIGELSNKAWYRAVKVVYLLSFLIIVALTITVFSTAGDFEVLDVPNSKIVCQYGNENQFFMKDIFANEEMPSSLPMYFSTKGTEVSQRILQACEITEILTQDTTDDGRFNFVPDPYRIEEDHKRQYGYLLLALLIITGIFEGIRRIFYYITLGTIQPQK